MSVLAQSSTSNKIAVPLTESEMNRLHGALMFEIDHLVALGEKSTTDEQTNNLRVQVGELTQTLLVFRNFWRNAITADALGGE
jgi:hypothetical protein